jgi:predicted PurR-regulated permease PerM
MQADITNLRKVLSEDLMSVFIRVGLIVLLVVLSARVFAPFALLILWALVLAVALYPLQRKLAGPLGGKQGRTATVIVICGLLLVGVPTVMLGGSFAEQAHGLYLGFKESTLKLPQPPAGVAEWPLVGAKIEAKWQEAANDFPAFVEASRPQLEQFFKWLFQAAAGTAGGILSFLVSLIIAGIMMAYAESGSRAMQRIYCRLAGTERGVKLHRLSIATVRSVATGVIGVAVIQALLLGVGFLFAGVPGAGILALVVLLVGILQLPALIITIPVIAYLWMGTDASTLSNSLFTVYLLIAGAADGFLKPMLLGRGVDAPMPIVLLGALGGMVSAGILGLFIGAIALTVGYVIFMEWVNQPLDDQPAAERPADQATDA